MVGRFENIQRATDEKRPVRQKRRHAGMTQFIRLKNLFRVRFCLTGLISTCSTATTAALEEPQAAGRPTLRRVFVAASTARVIGRG